MSDETSTAEKSSVIGVIPARFGSTRFPGKPLHLINNKPLIQHVWDQCQQCRNLDHVIVATDDERIAEAVRKFNGNVAMTSDEHPSGTDRIAEVAAEMPDATHIINIQGDEPLISPELIDHMAGQMIANPTVEMVTAANPMAADDPEVDNPNVVKVVLDRYHRALYFSRSPIPFERNLQEDICYYQHKGIYGYRRDFLLKFVGWEPSMLERVEGLEQLRALENGAAIQVIVSRDQSPGIDTPEQAAKLNQQLSS